MTKETKSQFTVTRFDQAYEDTVAARAELPIESLRTVNVDVPSSVATVLGALPQINEHLATIKLCPLTKDELRSVGRLEQYTLALGHAHALYVTATQPQPQLVALSEEGSKLRDTMLVDANALVQHGLIQAGRIANIRTALGYKPLAFDLMSLAAVFRDAWPTIRGKTPLAVETIERAGEIADMLITAVGAREQAPAVAAAATTERQRAFTLFFQAYEQTQRTIMFLRWNEGDADAIAPSLYAGRGNGNHKRKTDAPPDASSPAPTPTPPAVATAPQNGASHASELPGGSPFAP